MRPLLTFLLLLGAWLLWSGLTVQWHAEPFTSHGQVHAAGWHVDTFLLWLGLGSCGVSTLLAKRMGALDSEGQPYELTPRVLAYLPWLFVEIVKANLSVAKVIVAGPRAVGSTVFRVPVSQRTSIGAVIHANTITLTPGTITLDVRDGHLLVHSLTVDGADAASMRAIDRRISSVEGRPPGRLLDGDAPAGKATPARQTGVDPQSDKEGPQ